MQLWIEGWDMLEAEAQHFGNGDDVLEDGRIAKNFVVWRGPHRKLLWLPAAD